MRLQCPLWALLILVSLLQSKPHYSLLYPVRITKAKLIKPVYLNQSGHIKTGRVGCSSYSIQVIV